MIALEQVAAPGAHPPSRLQSLPPGDPGALRQLQAALGLAGVGIVDRGLWVERSGVVARWQGPSADVHEARVRRIADRLRQAGIALGDAAAASGDLAARLDEARAAWGRAMTLLEQTLGAGRGPSTDDVAHANHLFAQASEDAHAAYRIAEARFAAATEALAALAAAAAGGFPRRPSSIPALNPCGLFPEESAGAFWSVGQIPLNTQCLVWVETLVDVDGLVVVLPHPVPMTMPKGHGGRNGSKPGIGDEPIQTAEEKLIIRARIARMLAKGSVGERFEAQVAQNLLAHGEQVIGFHEPNSGGPPGRLLPGEIDIETRTAIIEVTVGKGGKADQAINFIDNKDLNPAGKQVIVFSPNYRIQAGDALSAAGVKVAHGMNDLLALLRSGRE